MQDSMHVDKDWKNMENECYFKCYRSGIAKFFFLIILTITVILFIDNKLQSGREKTYCGATLQ